MFHVIIWDDIEIKPAAYVNTGAAASVHLEFRTGDGMGFHGGRIGYAAITLDAADALAAELRRAAEDARARNAVLNPEKVG